MAEISNKANEGSRIDKWRTTVGIILLTIAAVGHFLIIAVSAGLSLSFFGRQ